MKHKWVHVRHDGSNSPHISRISGLGVWQVCPMPGWPRALNWRHQRHRPPFTVEALSSPQSLWPLGAVCTLLCNLPATLPTITSFQPGRPHRTPDRRSRHLRFLTHFSCSELELQISKLSFFYVKFWTASLLCSTSVRDSLQELGNQSRSSVVSARVLHQGEG